MFSVDLSSLSLLLGNMPESLALLLFGVTLTGATVALRWLLKRHDNANADNKTDTKG